MSDEELIARLRERPYRLGLESEEQAKMRRQAEREAAADRIQALAGAEARALEAFRERDLHIQATAMVGAELARVCRLVVDAYDTANPVRTGDQHADDCCCLRCAVDAARTYAEGRDD